MNQALSLGEKLGWKILNERRLLMKARLMYKVTHDKAPVRLAEIFNMSSPFQHDYKLQNSDMKLYLPKPKTDYVKKSLRYSGAKLWNSRSSETRNAVSLNSFHTHIFND